LTPDQVAERLQVSTETIRRLCREHRLKAIRIGRQRRVREQDLEEYLDCNSRQATLQTRDLTVADALSN
jgi:excisionase family DNA binding protein